MESKENIVTNENEVLDFRAAAIEIGKTLADHKGLNVVVLDLCEKHIWTDYFVIATATSSAHSGGLEKYALERIAELGLSKYRVNRRNRDGEEWKLIDCGNLVIHIMTETARKFYELEKLMYDCKNILQLAE